MFAMYLVPEGTAHAFLPSVKLLSQVLTARKPFSYVGFGPRFSTWRDACYVGWSQILDRAHAFCYVGFGPRIRSTRARTLICWLVPESRPARALLSGLGPRISNRAQSFCVYRPRILDPRTPFC
jgi:hypothetical protein